MTASPFDNAQNGNPLSTTPIQTLLSDGGTGPNRRIKVDVGEADFFAGRRFRMYKAATILKDGSAPLSIRFTCAINFILSLQQIAITQGAIQLQVFRDDVSTPIVPSGTWTNIPVIGSNRMSTVPLPVYATQMAVQSGGTFTGGVEVDLIQIRASAANNTATNVTQGINDRGLPAGAYYLRFNTLTGGLVVNDDCQMIYRAEWMERPPSVYPPST